MMIPGPRWWVALLSCVVGLATSCRLSIDRTEWQPDPPPVTPDVTAEPLVAQADSAWLLAPFRPDRSVPPQRYSRATPPSDREPPVRRPDWILTGVLGGPVPVALFEGVDGAENSTTLLATGDAVGRFRLAAIRGDTVVVVSDDEEWLFSLEAEWR